MAVFGLRTFYDTDWDCGYKRCKIDGSTYFFPGFATSFDVPASPRERFAIDGCSCSVRLEMNVSKSKRFKVGIWIGYEDNLDDKRTSR